jgi:hypothetical protein
MVNDKTERDLPALDNRLGLEDIDFSLEELRQGKIEVNESYSWIFFRIMELLCAFK